jgi:hypothetical protein
MVDLEDLSGWRSMNAEYRGGFPEFYPAYLAQHTERSTRRLHFLSVAGDFAMFEDMLLGRLPW